MPNDQTIVRTFFQQYVYGFMKNDIEKAIAGGANILAALGLVVYSEVLGALRTGTITNEGHNQRKFEAFLPLLGPLYESVDQELKKDPRSPKGLYQVVRCGLAHEYFVKEPADFYRHGSVAAGIFREPGNARLTLVAKKFLDDFVAAAQAVENELAASPNPDTVRFMSQFVTQLQPAVSGAVAPPFRPPQGPITGGTFTPPSGPRFGLQHLGAHTCARHGWFSSPERSSRFARTRTSVASYVISTVEPASSPFPSTQSRGRTTARLPPVLRILRILRSIKSFTYTDPY